MEKEITECKDRCNILVCGTVSSGSSAINNLLKEYDNIGYFPFEFDDFRAPGLVADQLSCTSCINFPNKIDEIARFNHFISRIVLKSSIWKFIPKSFLDLNYNNRLYRRAKELLIILNRFHLLLELNKKIKMNIPIEKKILFTHQWIQNIGDVFSLKKEFILFDQPIQKTTDISTWTTVFNPYKLIIVYRNPGDQIADMIKRKTFFKHYGSPNTTSAGFNIDSIYGRKRKSALRFHVDAIKKRLKWIDRLEDELDSDHLLVIDFEGLVNNYDEYKLKVEEFIGGIKEHHQLKYKFFDPDRSKENIGICNKYLNNEDLKDLKELDNWYTKRIKNKEISTYNYQTIS